MPTKTKVTVNAHGCRIKRDSATTPTAVTKLSSGGCTRALSILIEGIEKHRVSRLLSAEVSAAKSKLADIVRDHFTPVGSSVSLGLEPS